MLKLAVVLALVSGCSVALQSKPRAGGVAQRECSTSSLYWVADAAIAGLGAAGAVGGTALAISERDGSEEVGWTIAGVSAVAAVVYYASMDNGRRWRRECSALESAPIAAR